MKLCIKCGEKPTREHSRSWCLECSKEYERNRWANLDRDSKRGKWLKHRYGKDIDWYQKTLEEQQNSCAICSTTIDPDGSHSNSKACVDHDHITGQVRGLLCNHCNRAIGLFKEDKETMKKAIEYLERYE